jgi:L-alanine-DL-glutamate epimerase-like enolase superfamily enzyme
VHPKVPGWKAQNPIHADDYSDDLDSIDSNGCVDVPEGPGLGAVINWEWLKKVETGKVVYE